MRIAVLASGEGSNLQALIDQVHRRESAEIVRVVSDKPAARALERAGAAEIPSAVLELTAYADRAARDAAIADLLRDDGVELVVLAGYMAILSPGFIAAFAGRIINVHPSLLPKFPGLDAIGQAISAGESETGVTVHFVDEGVDTGPVIAQQSLTIAPDESLDHLTQRIHQLEHHLLPQTVLNLSSQG
jgi:phosphoribosylglycinamide formyltransferase-1